MDAIISEYKDAIFELCDKHHVRTLHLFGSVLDAKAFRPESDIDMLVAFQEEKLSLEDYAEAYFNLAFALESLLHRIGVNLKKANVILQKKSCCLALFETIKTEQASSNHEV